MLDLDKAINLSFRIPAKDPLGREEVLGKLRFLPKECELNWQMAGNVFTGGKSEMKVITIPYGEIEEVEVKKKWLRPALISFHINDPSLVKEIPGVDMGNLIFEIDKKSSKDLDRLQGFIDFKRSLFLFESTDSYLKEISR